MEILKHTTCAFHSFPSPRGIHCYNHLVLLTPVDWFQSTTTPSLQKANWNKHARNPSTWMNFHSMEHEHSHSYSLTQDSLHGNVYKHSPLQERPVMLTWKFCTTSNCRIVRCQCMVEEINLQAMITSVTWLQDLELRWTFRSPDVPPHLWVNYTAPSPKMSRQNNGNGNVSASRMVTLTPCRK